MTEQHPFKWRHYEAEIILLCVRWYLRYSLSYRDLEEIMLERGLHVDHTTIYRWVQRYAPELQGLFVYPFYPFKRFFSRTEERGESWAFPHFKRKGSPSFPLLQFLYFG